MNKKCYLLKKQVLKICNFMTKFSLVIFFKDKNGILSEKSQFYDKSHKFFDVWNFKI